MLGLALAGIPVAQRLQWPRSQRRLFFGPEEINRIRANAETPLLKAAFEEWMSLPASEARGQITKAAINTRPGVIHRDASVRGDR